MKLAITIENKQGLTDEVLSLLKSHQAEILKVEVEGDKIFLHTKELIKAVQGTIASQLMKIKGVKWVNQVDALPGVENQNMLASLMQVMPDPVLAVNTRGQIVYSNRQADTIFKPFTENHKIPDQMKYLFVAENWQKKVNLAADSQLPVAIKTIAGSMLLEVQSIKDRTGQINGAMLLFKGCEKIRVSNDVIQAEEIDGLNRLVYRSEAFTAIVQKGKMLAHVDAPLSIVGEAGTGKTLLAHACHSMSQRSHELFTLIDCQALKSDEIEGLLFGTRKQPGILQPKLLGTVFFSHIEFLALHIQKKLLLYIEQNSERLKFRIMVSSAQRMGQYQKTAVLIPELVLMFDVLRLNVSSLRERPEDIEPLIKHFLHQFNEQLEKDVLISQDAINKIKRYHWPRNVSQLRQTIYQAIVNAKDNTIQANELDLEGVVSTEIDLEGLTLNEAVNDFESHFLQRWYQKYPSTRKLARQLGVSHTTIAQKIKKYNLKQQQD